MAPTIAQASASRTRKLNRRLAFHPTIAAVYPPHSRTYVPPAEDQQHHRKQAIRDQLRLAHLLGKNLIHCQLDQYDWDVAAAVGVTRIGDLHTRIGGAAIEYLQCPISKSVEPSRLKALQTFRTLVNSVRPTPIDLSDCILLEFLQGSKWIIQEAFQVQQRRPHTIDDIVDKLGGMSTSGPSDTEKSERWVAFITMTGTGSHYSARLLLEGQDWSYVDTVNRWSALGRLPNQLSDGPRRGLREIIANDHPVDVHGIPIDPATRIPVDAEAVPSTASHLAEVSIDEDLPSTEVQDMKRHAAETKLYGFIIDHDPLPSKLGCINHTKLKIEYIRGMEYCCAWYNRSTFPRLDSDSEVTDDQTDRVEFDFNNSKDISLLARWRNERYLKLGYEPKKPEAVGFLPVEHDFIFDQMHVHAEEVHLQKLKAAAAISYPGIALAQLGPTRRMALCHRIRPWFDDHNNWPLDISQATKERMTDQFNEMFEGNTRISGVINGRIYDNELIAAEPRPARSLIMLDGQRFRIRRGCRDFMLKYNPAHEDDAATPEHGTDSEPEKQGED
jgi:hypothetical protein